MNAELTGGSKALSLSSGADVSLVNDRLFLVTGYGFLKQADIPADGAVPALKIARFRTSSRSGWIGRRRRTGC